MKISAAFGKSVAARDRKPDLELKHEAAAEFSQFASSACCRQCDVLPIRLHHAPTVLVETKKRDEDA